jgi:phosphoribosylaminoimidazole carboxylase PurE protein
MGSPNDAPVMQGAVDVLKELGITVEMTVASAHRSPERVMRLLGEAETRGVKVFIVGAGAAAHLGGVVAAHVSKPVIGVPIDSSALNGLDALLSTVQMPPGVPVATRFDRQSRRDQCRRACGADTWARATKPLPTVWRNTRPGSREGGGSGA